MNPPSVAIHASRAGIHLPEAGVWLDAHRSAEVCVITHAHSDHVARHGKTLCSVATARLLRDRFGGSGEVVALPWGEPWEHAGHRFVLTPAGHVLGSAMVHVTRLSDGATLLYTGDFKLRAGLSAEAARPLPAETLIMECTFGQPHYRFPDFQAVTASIRSWCRGALENGETPVLLGYSLGKAQEIQMILGGEFPVAVHSSVAEMNRCYEALGWPLPPWKILTENTAGSVLVVPPSAVRSQALRRRKRLVTAMVSGWAINAGARYQYQCDEAFALSDHADWPDLLRLVELVAPQQIFTTHGPAAEFAHALRERGWNAWSLAGSDQMELDLGGLSEAPPSPEDHAAAGTGEFAAFADCCDAVAAAAGRTEKAALIAAWLRGLPDDQLAAAVRFLAGKPAATRAELSEIQAGPAVIRQALIDAAGLTLAAYRAVSRVQNDAGRTAYLLLQGRTVPRPWTLAEVQSVFGRLRSARGGTARTAILAEAFRGMDAREAQYLVKILTGDTRIGLKEGLLEEAVAAAFNAPADEVREAHMLCGDIGATAQLARRGALHEAGLTLFQPVKVMLASPEESAGAVWERMAAEGPEPLWLEDKFDGIRAQFHIAGGRCEVFSRDLREVSREFPELVRAAAGFRDEVVLDGEIIAPGLNGRADFAALQKRLGRREPDLFLADEVPVRCVLFDLLWLNGKSLLGAPLEKRRLLLDTVVLPDGFERIAIVRAESSDALERAFMEAKARGAEGLIIKAPQSAYAAGRRGKSWLKLKRSPLALDVVVTAAQQGHGKRSHLLSDYTFAVRDPRDGSLRNIGKAYSGLTDAEIEALTEHFTRQTLSTDGRVRTVVPDTVLEVTFDSIQASSRHDSGFALRFPRIRAIRRDKTAEDIDTLEEAARLAALCRSGGES